LYGDALRLRDLLVAIEKENKVRAGDGRSPLVVLFVTFTGQHNAGEDLRSHMRDFSSAFSRTMRCASVRKWREALGFVGSVRCFDHTVAIREGGALDWHAHFHTLLIFETAKLWEGSPSLAAFSRALFDAWAARVGAAWEDGRRAVLDAFDVELVSLAASEEYSTEALADYAAKVAALPAYMTKEKKAGGRQARGGFSPWDLLDNWTGECGDVFSRAWVEYVEGTKGYHRVDFSTGLLARFGLNEIDSPVPSARYVLPAPVAVTVLDDPAIYDKLKDAILAEDWSSAVDVLGDFGLEGFAVECVSPRDVGEKMTEGKRSAERQRQTRARVAASPELLKEMREEEDRRVASTPRPVYPAFEWLLDS
jgi:hypothetical protein